MLPAFHLTWSLAFLIFVGLTQLVGGWGCLGGLCPPKHPRITLNCVTSNLIKEYNKAYEMSIKW
jgi:hypothetical protein